MLIVGVLGRKDRSRSLVRLETGFHLPHHFCHYLYRYSLVYKPICTVNLHYNSNPPIAYLFGEDDRAVMMPSFLLSAFSLSNISRFSTSRRRRPEVGHADSEAVDVMHVVTQFTVAVEVITVVRVIVNVLKKRGDANLIMALFGVVTTSKEGSS